MSGLLVTEVLPGGIGAEVGIEPGDRILSINGHPLRDIIDYNYYADEEELSLELLHRGEPASCEVERDEDESLGLIFESPEPARCGNQCIFCFVHQLPKGLRPPLYVKDEDYRLSFLYGNYVTLANITETDLERIVSQRLSPLYVSVHATEESLRRRLLGNDDILPILPLLQRLSSAGITFHTQVVLCPGINDGSHLQRTVQDLADLLIHKPVRRDDEVAELVEASA
jgi:putative radical SAM enzyme (TIGR03279 family)